MVCKHFPQFNILSALAFILKTIDAVDTRTLMVAPQQKEVKWIFDFVCHEETHDFN